MNKWISVSVNVGLSFVSVSFKGKPHEATSDKFGFCDF